MKFSQNRAAFNTALLNIADPFFAVTLDDAINNKLLINYKDTLPRLFLVDAEINNSKLTLYFVTNEPTRKPVTETLKLTEYDIKQSNSAPNKFYFEPKSNPHDYFVIIFKC